VLVLRKWLSNSLLVSHTTHTTRLHGSKESAVSTRTRHIVIYTMAQHVPYTVDMMMSHAIESECSSDEEDGQTQPVQFDIPVDQLCTQGITSKADPYETESDDDEEDSVTATASVQEQQRQAQRQATLQGILDSESHEDNLAMQQRQIRRQEKLKVQDAEDLAVDAARQHTRAEMHTLHDTLMKALVEEQQRQVQQQANALAEVNALHAVVAMALAQEQQRQVKRQAILHAILDREARDDDLEIQQRQIQRQAKIQLQDSEDVATDAARQHTRSEANALQDELDTETEAVNALRQLARANAIVDQNTPHPETETVGAAGQRIANGTNAETANTLRQLARSLVPRRTSARRAESGVGASAT
jgi:CRISPR/Cas system CSM-associated protein Csm2 small subunit